MTGRLTLRLAPVMRLVLLLVKKGQLLFDFDRELIKQSEYEDSVITFFAQPHNIEAANGFTPGKTAKLGDKVVTVEFKLR